MAAMSPRYAAGGYVLVGGQSKRMGQDKALLVLGGQLLALRTVERVRPVVAEVKLVGSPARYPHLGVPVVADAAGGKGPLGGIVAALRDTAFDWNLVVACDLPYLTTRFLEWLLGQAANSGESDALVPQSEESAQPLCAAYHRRALPAFERVLSEGDPKIDRAFPQLRVRFLPPAELLKFAFTQRMFKNMNTPEDYAEAMRIIKV
jgi:molybdopterin-guanine dinucleotide biosynthesis protein A